MDPKIESELGRMYLVDNLTGKELKQESEEITVRVAFLNISSRIVELHKIDLHGIVKPIRLLQPGEGTWLCTAESQPWVCTDAITSKYMLFAPSHLKIFYPCKAEHDWNPGSQRPIDVLLYEPMPSLLDYSLRKVAKLASYEKLIGNPLEIPPAVNNRLLQQYIGNDRLFWGPSRPTKQKLTDAYNSVDQRIYRQMNKTKEEKEEAEKKKNQQPKNNDGGVDDGKPSTSKMK